MEQLRRQLSEIINNSQLPAECIFYVFKDVFRDLQEQYNALLKAQEQAGELASQPQKEKEVNE